MPIRPPLSSAELLLATILTGVAIGAALLPLCRMLVACCARLRRPLHERRALDGVLVLITGAAGGLGSALARRFAQEGARLVLWDVDELALRDLRSQLLSAGIAANPFHEPPSRATDCN